jgi:5-methylcytosine-specific restriction endonuclease McrA
MGKKENTYVKSMKQIHERISKKKNEISELETELLSVYKKEKKFWNRSYFCSICGDKQEKTEWHHIISQHRCRELGKEYLIYARSNVVEVCKPCHDETTASLRRSVMENPVKVVKNVEGPPTDKQLNFIKKLGGENLINTITTRQEASTLIDQLKGEGK